MSVSCMFKSAELREISEIVVFIAVSLPHSFTAVKSNSEVVITCRRRELVVEPMFNSKGKLLLLGRCPTTRSLYNPDGNATEPPVPWLVMLGMRIGTSVITVEAEVTD